MDYKLHIDMESRSLQISILSPSSVLPVIVIGLDNKFLTLKFVRLCRNNDSTDFLKLLEFSGFNVIVF